MKKEIRENAGIESVANKEKEFVDKLTESTVNSVFDQTVDDFVTSNAGEELDDEFDGDVHEWYNDYGRGEVEEEVVGFFSQQAKAKIGSSFDEDKFTDLLLKKFTFLKSPF